MHAIMVMLLNVVTDALCWSAPPKAALQPVMSHPVMTSGPSSTPYPKARAKERVSNRDPRANGGHLHISHHVRMPLDSRQPHHPGLSRSPRRPMSLCVDSRGLEQR